MNDILSKNRNKNQLLDMAFIQFENNHGVLPRFINIILTWHLFSGTSSKRTKSLNETITVLSTIFRRYFHRLKLFMLFYILGTQLKNIFTLSKPWPLPANTLGKDLLF